MATQNDPPTKITELPLTAFELPKWLVEPAVRSCRLFNTALDFIFYAMLAAVSTASGKVWELAKSSPHINVTAHLCRRAARLQHLPDRDQRTASRYAKVKGQWRPSSITFLFLAACSIDGKDCSGLLPTGEKLEKSTPRLENIKISYYVFEIIGGFTDFEPSVVSKWLGLLKEVAPTFARSTSMFNPDVAPHAPYYLRAVDAASRELGLETAAAPVRSDADVETAVAALARNGDGALIVIPDSFMNPHRRVRQSGVDLKPPQAAVVKSDGGERCGKVGTRFRQV
jgi:hypothetical protein